MKPSCEEVITQLIKTGPLIAVNFPLGLPWLGDEWVSPTWQGTSTGQPPWGDRTRWVTFRETVTLSVTVSRWSKTSRQLSSLTLVVLQNSDLWRGNQKKIPVNILARKNKKHSGANAITVAGVTEALLIGQSQSQFSWLTSPPQVWCPGGTELRTGRRTTFAPWSPPPRTCSPHWMWRPVWPTSVSPSLPNKHPPSPRAQTTRLNRVAAGLVSWLMTVISLLLIVMKTPGKYYQLENYTINILSRSVPMYKTRILLHLVSSILVSPLLYRIYQQAAGLLKHLDDSVDQGRWLGLSHCCRLHSYFTAFHCQTDLFSKLLLFPKIIF